MRATFEIKPGSGKKYLVHNRTPKQIRVVDDQLGELVLSPLAQRVITGCRLAPFAGGLVGLRQRHQLRVRRYHDSPRPFQLVTTATMISMTVLAVLTVLNLVTVGTLERLDVALAVSVSVLLVGIVIVLADRAEKSRVETEAVFDADEGDIEFGVGGTFYDGNETIRRAKQLLTLLVVVAIGAVLPAIAIFVATDAKDFLVMDGGLHVVDGYESRLVGRVIQVLYTATLSLFPALLYFQFDRHRVGTIRAEWVRSIFRMDKRMKTLADVNARYGDELAEASSYSTDSVRLLGGRNSPIIVATLLISLGWTLLVVQTDSFDFAGSSEVAVLADAADAAAVRAAESAEAVEAGTLDANVGAATAAAARDEAIEASRAAAAIADLPIDDVAASADDTAAAAAEEAAAAAATAAAAGARIDQPFFQIILPTPSAAAMAFLGAYFFGAYLILRSYFRGDLRPKIYSQITARLITVVVLAYLIQALFTSIENNVVWALSFVAGVVPTTVLQGIGQLITKVGAGNSSTAERGLLRGAFVEAFGRPRALTQIDGIDLYDSTRLETEGINDIPSLAKADLVSVMVSTHLPVERLVDWMDQAVLLLLLTDPDEITDAENAVPPVQTRRSQNSRVEQLRRLGIRTASEILATNRRNADPDLRSAADHIIRENARSRPGAPTLASLAAQIRREPAMRRILQFQRSELANVHRDCPEIVESNAPLFPTLTAVTNVPPASEATPKAS